jgi:hypothetical protein
MRTEYTSAAARIQYLFVDVVVERSRDDQVHFGVALLMLA